MTPPKVPASGTAPAAPACTDFSPVNLKPFRELPPVRILSAGDKADPALMNYYDKVGAYIMMDASDYGIGNGNGVLEQDEAQKFLAKYPSNNPRVNTCTLLGEARDFSKIAPSLTEAAQKGLSVAEGFKSATRQVQQEAVAEKQSTPIWQYLLGVAVIGWLIKKIITKMRGGGPKDGPKDGGSSGPKNPEPPKKKTVEASSLNGKSPAVVVPVDGKDLSSQINRLYGGAQVYAGAAAPSLPAPLTQGGGLPVVLPLVTPLPLTLPAVKPVVPVVRPVPVLAR